jgi:hypothetical protein
VRKAGRIGDESGYDVSGLLACRHSCGFRVGGVILVFASQRFCYNG